MTLLPEQQPLPAQPYVPEVNLAFAVYICYAIAFFTGGFTSIVGVIIAYVKVGDADPMLKSHYVFQIRTFWLSLLYLVVGIVLCFILIGIFVLLWWCIWLVVRIVKGLLALNERKPIAHPSSWLFG
jgi:uncharacterized membrane protein